MSRIFWDTNLFIYLIEGSGERTDAVLRLRERMLARNDALYTSTLTLGEVLVKPTEENEPVLAAGYEKALTAGATVLTFDVKAARMFAAIRKDRSIRFPDAIQLASLRCGSEGGPLHYERRQTERQDRARGPVRDLARQSIPVNRILLRARPGTQYVKGVDDGNG